MNKIIVVLLSFLFISTCISITACGRGIKIWPGKINIDINKWYEDVSEVDHPIITITNPESYDIRVTVRIDNPAKEVIEEGYSYIPDKSWVKAVPDEVVVPARSSRQVEIFIEVPEGEQSNNYNASWEAWVYFSSPPEPGGPYNIQTNLAVKLFIKTPEGVPAGIQPIHILLFFFIFLVMLYLAITSFRKKKSENVVYYFKDKKRGGSKF